MERHVMAMMCVISKALDTIRINYKCRYLLLDVLKHNILDYSHGVHDLNEADRLLS